MGFGKVSLSGIVYFASYMYRLRGDKVHFPDKRELSLRISSIPEF